MLVSILITVVSVILLSYWFRYTCILLLRSNSAQPAVNAGSGPDAVRLSLERDFRLLTYVWQHAAGLGEQSLEERILVLDFKVMRLWYRLTRTTAPAQANKALAEMSAVVSFLSQKLGQQAGLAPQTTR
jgi:hypothetical protein